MTGQDSIIQQARDTLAKWRTAARDGEWSIESDTAESSWLGRGTAGNPDLLDALDGLLQHHAEDGWTVSAVASWVRLIAAAIVAAEERMQS